MTFFFFCLPPLFQFKLKRIIDATLSATHRGNHHLKGRRGGARGSLEQVRGLHTAARRRKRRERESLRFSKGGEETGKDRH